MKMIMHNLDYEIETILIEKELEKEIEKEDEKNLKNTLIDFKDNLLTLAVPVLWGITLFNFNKATLIAASIVSVSEVTNIYFKHYFNRKNQERLSKITIPKEEIEKYYKEEYLEELEKYKVENADLIQRNNIELNLEVLGTNNLSKNETKSRFDFELDEYYKSYKLPKFKLNENEINEYFHKTYDFFINNNITDDYYKYISYVYRMTLARALVENKKEILLKDFIFSLLYLDVLNNNLNQEEITNLKRDIGNINVIPIEKYLKK